MHVETGASAQSVQAHARSRNVNQSVLRFATQTPAFENHALLDRDTYLVGNFAARQEDLAVITRILRTLQTLKNGAICPTEWHCDSHLQAGRGRTLFPS